MCVSVYVCVHARMLGVAGKQEGTLKRRYLG